MSIYLIINICIISVPLLLSFESKINFYKNFIPVSISILLTGLIFVSWDIIAVNNNDWFFNIEYISGIMVFNLPAEEILFFITVPFAILFTYECVCIYFSNKIYNKYFSLLLIYSVVSFAAAFLNLERSYTSTVLLFTGIVSALIFLSGKKEFMSKPILITILISFIPFFIINYFLTSLPVVIYNTEAIIGLKILTIPFEDVFYSISMISCWLFIYMLARQKCITNRIIID